MTKIFIQDYSGYVYLWFDARRKMFYVGSHLGDVNDKYIGSNKWLKDAYKKRPEDFKMRVLEYDQGDVKSLQTKEQYWLDMIQDSELSTSKNVMEGRNRYFNMKKSARGGGIKGKRGKRNGAAWNKGLEGKQTHSADTRRKMREARTAYWQAKERVKHEKECPGCECKFNALRKYCSKKCIPKRIAWNKGLKRKTLVDSVSKFN
jgi:hypothetical protein